MLKTEYESSGSGTFEPQSLVAVFHISTNSPNHKGDEKCTHPVAHCSHKLKRSSLDHIYGLLHKIDCQTDLTRCITGPNLIGLTILLFQFLREIRSLRTRFLSRALDIIIFISLSSNLQ